MKHNHLPPFALLFLGVWVFGAVPSARAADLIVPRDYSTIGAALSAAVPGDRVVVYAGVYSRLSGETFPLDLPDGVTLVGKGKESTILDGTTSGQPVLRVAGIALTADIVVESLQIRGGGGLSVDGGAVSVTNVTGGAVVVRDCFLQSNTGNRGGAVWASDCILRIENSEIRGNLSENQGGAVAASGASTSLTLISSLIADNVSTKGSGGGVAGFGGAELGIIGGQVESNLARFAGGVFVEGTLSMTADPDGSPAVIRLNTGKSGIGGLQAAGGSVVDLDQVAIEYNSSSSAAALRVSNSTVAMDRCSIAYNTASVHVAEFFSSSLALSNLRVYRNRSTSGGTLWLENSWGDLVYCTLAGNVTANSDIVGTISINGAPNFPATPLRIRNSVIAENTGIGIAERTLNSDPQFEYNLVFGNSRGFYTDEIVLVYTTGTQLQTLLNNSPQSVGNLRVGAPDFRRPGYDDYRLKVSSDGLDAALSLPAIAAADHDFEGNSRTQAASGPAPDIGAHESLSPHLQGPVLFYQGSELLSVTDEQLVFQFDRPIRLTAPLAPTDFYLPVTADAMAAGIVSEVDPRNPTHLVVTMQAPYNFRVSGLFSMSALTPGSPSGIDLLAGAGTLKVVDADLGVPSIPAGSDPLANTTAIDIGLVGGPETSTGFPPQIGGVLEVDPTSYLPETSLLVNPNALVYPTTLKMRPVAFPRASFSAVRIEIVSGSPVLYYELPAYLTLHYDPEEYRAWGYRESDLAIYRLTEVDWDVFEFQSVTHLYGYPETHDYVNHTITARLGEIVAPRPVFPTFVEPYEGPMSAIYVVLPNTILSGTIRVDPVIPGPAPVPASLHLAAPEDHTLSGAGLLNYVESASSTAVEVKVRRASAIHEITGTLPRPLHPTPAGVLAFEAKQLSPTGATPLESMLTPVNAIIQMSDGIHSDQPTDFWSWDGIPVSAYQMQMYRYDPATQDWILLPDYRTFYDGQTRSLVVNGTYPFYSAEGLGVYSVMGDPDRPANLDFALADHGWEPGDASPTLPGAIASYDGGLLKLTADGPEGYAWWGAPSGAFVPRRDQLFHLTYEVATDTASTLVPGVSMRVNSGDGQRLAAYSVLGVSTFQSVPTVSTPRKYHLFFEPSGRSVEAAYAGDAFQSTYVPFFEMLHFIPGKSETGMIGLKTFDITPIDLGSLGPWTRKYTYDFIGTRSQLGWRLYGAPGSITYYNLFGTSSGLKFYGGQLNHFAGIGSPGSLTLQPGLLYRVRYTVHANAEPDEVPSFRLRVGDTGFETASNVMVISAQEAQESPGFKSRTYDVYYYPPQPLAALGNVRLGCYFDYINFTASDKTDTIFTIPSVVVDSTPWVP